MNTKALMILGSVVGFLIGTGSGVAADSSWSSTFWRASVAALAAAMLVRWWGRIWLNSLRDAVEQRRTHKRSPIAAKSAAKI